MTDRSPNRVRTFSEILFFYSDSHLYFKDIRRPPGTPACLHGMILVAQIQCGRSDYMAQSQSCISRRAVSVTAFLLSGSSRAISAASFLPRGSSFAVQLRSSCSGFEEAGVSAGVWRLPEFPRWCAVTAAVVGRKAMTEAVKKAVAVAAESAAVAVESGRCWRHW